MKNPSKLCQPEPLFADKICIMATPQGFFAALRMTILHNGD